MKSENWIDLDRKTLEAQQIARSVAKRAARRIMFLMLAGIAIIVGVMVWLFKMWPFVLLIPFFIMIYLFSNWQQWNLLLTQDLRCPHCTQPLAKRVHLLRSPTSHCPHCGKIALAPIDRLEVQEAVD